jgi:hypothetical protein
MLFTTIEFTMAQNPLTTAEGEGTSMLIRRGLGQETISSDIALLLAEMIFVRKYGKDYTDARSPLVLIDHGDRWEVQSCDGVNQGERLKIVIVKTNGRILDLARF